MSSPIRVIILCYKRWGNVNAIVKALHKYFPITVINNLENHEYTNENAEVMNNEVNHYCMIRWIKSAIYPEPFKLVLDDDILLSPKSIKKLCEQNHNMTGIMGYTGVNNSKNYFELNRVFNENKKVDFLVGSAIMIKQSCLDAIMPDLLNSNYPKRGDDIIVSYLIKNKFKCSLHTTECDHLVLPEHSVGLNLQKEHFHLRWQVVEKFKKLGWT